MKSKEFSLHLMRPMFTQAYWSECGGGGGDGDDDDDPKGPQSYLLCMFFSQLPVVMSYNNCRSITES